MSSILFLLTRKCNYQCAHCYISCGPHGESLSLEQAKRIIDHFPQRLSLLGLSGGEVFLVKPLLYGVLEYLSKRFPNCQVYIKTNGFWGRTDEQARETINELLDLNLNFPIKLSMHFDPFHEAEGLRIAYLYRIIRMIESDQRTKYKLRFELIETTYWSDRAVPLGRAASQVPKDRWNIHRKCSDYYYPHGIMRLLMEKKLSINWRGEVFKCCFVQHKPMGNAITTPIDKIKKDAYSDPILNLLLKRGIKSVARQRGFSEKEIKELVKEGGECWLCSKVFSNAI